MKKNNMKRFLASLLAVLMLASVTGVSPAVFAGDAGSNPPSQEEAVNPELKEKSGEVLIKSSMSDDEVSKLISKALISNYDQLDDTAKANLQWEYYCKGKEAFPAQLTNEGWGSINGFTTSNKIWGVNHTYYHVALKDTGEGSYQVRLAGTTKEATLVKVDKYTSKLELKQGVSITYNMDAAKEKEAIVANVIDYEKSVLPAGTTADDFTVEHKSGLLWPDIPDSKLDAGENQTIRIKYNGNETYKASNRPEATINVAKATVKVSMKRFTTVYAGQNIDKDVLKVALDPNDPAIDVYLVFAGINTKLDTSVNLVLTKEQWTVIENISKFQKFIFDLDTQNVIFKDKTTLQQKLEKGMTIGEFKAYMLGFIDDLEKATDLPIIGDAIKAEMEKYGISIDSLKTMATIFDKLTAFSDDTQIALGAPKHAGLYTAFALAVNKNYNTGVANGIVCIAMNTAGMKLVPNADIKGKSIDVETAVQMRDTGVPALATLYCGESAENVDQTSIHYWFTGVNTVYAGSKMPTKPGKYIVTASVYGGDYMAAPVTFTFRITK